jgi:anti-sigma B factor antagonist
MKIDVSEKSGVVLFTVQGEMIGGPDATQLSEKLHEFISAGKKQMVISMAGVKWMNSSGLGILIGSLNTARRAGGDLKLACLTEKPRHLLKITRLDQVFVICESEDDAIAQFVR